MSQQPAPEDLGWAGDDELPLTVDPLLVTLLLQVANDATRTVPITLSTTGGVVTGKLVGWDAWIKGFELLGLQRAAAMEDLVSSVSTEMSQAGLTTQLQGDFVHLVEAKFVLGSELLPFNVNAVWRGRLGDVVGWSLGQVGEYG